jgi:GntP family gluconate:H+ symporter
VLSIPVFFDTVFYLLAPLARSIYARTKKNYTLLIMAVAAGAVITHALVPPTPGPIIVAEKLGISLGNTILVGLLSSIVPLLVGGVFFANYINKRITLHPSDALGVSQQELEETAQKPDSELPGLFFSLLPILLPILFIAVASSVEMLLKTERFTAWGANDPGGFEQIQHWNSFLGDKNIVFFVGALISIILLLSQKSYNLKETFKRLEPAIVSGAMIAFITCAGGAFGEALAASGVGDVIQQWAETLGLSLLVLAFLTAALIRIAQGSATVAMMTTVAIIAPALSGIDPDFHIAFLVPMIGFGATTTSWMNDSGFWIVSQMAGISEKDTLKTWTTLLTVIAVSGFVWVLILAKAAALVLPV